MAEPRPDLGATSLTLLDRARANEADAWTRLVALYTPLVRHWCIAGGLQSTDVDDVVQEVCRAALAGLPTFRRDRAGDTFRGWLRALTRTALALHFRRRGRVPVASGGNAAFALLQEVAEPVPELPEDDPSDEIRGLHRRAVELVRGEFEDRTWQMFWLTAAEDQEPADVAARFGVTPAAVRKAKSRVLRRLREEIGDLLD
ncbi:MAG: sigma-70 family RNA polymerase sigma factor [Isosphaeraceae bacterium]|nr:sigma-70 family RNA polymerase sigma factor [Isosphaeraceae bacterium]